MQPYKIDKAFSHTQQSGLSNAPSGGLLCGALLKAYEGASANLINERWLVGKSLSLLLASSTSAKQTGLKGELKWLSPRMVVHEASIKVLPRVI